MRSGVNQYGSFLNQGADIQQYEFDPECVIPWLGNDSNNQVVLCGYSFGGCEAMFQFLRILQLNSIDMKELMDDGRYDKRNDAS